MKPDKKSQAAELISVLAEKLPDAALQVSPKEHSPGEARKLLRQAAAVLDPSKKGKPATRSQGTLWQDGEKEWQGKLAGKTLQLYTDGASRGNPGEAGCGIVILDEAGNELVGTGQYLGKCTNNEAEYRGLLFGLEKCAEFGSGSLKVYLDSELIVKQIRGEYKVKHPNLKPLFQKTMNDLARFSSYSVAHVVREENSRADHLANQAIDNK